MGQCHVIFHLTKQYVLLVWHTLFRGRPKKQSFGMGSGGFLEWGYPQTISNHPVMDDHDLVLKPMTWEYTISRNPHFLRDNKKALLGWQTMFFWRGHNSSFGPRNILWYGDMEVSYRGVPQLIQVMDDHDSVLKQPAGDDWGSTILRNLYILGTKSERGCHTKLVNWGWFTSPNLQGLWWNHTCLLGGFNSNMKINWVVSKKFGNHPF